MKMRILIIFLLRGPFFIFETWFPHAENEVSQSDPGWVSFDYLVCDPSAHLPIHLSVYPPIILSPHPSIHVIITVLDI